KRKCLYCMYNSRIIESESELGKYVGYLAKEASFFSGAFKNFHFKTMHIGGGSPTLLSEKLLKKLFSEINSNFSFTAGGSRTLEIKPTQVTDEQLAVAVSSGVNRISVGVQSLNPAALSNAGRDYADIDCLSRITDRLRSLGVDAVNFDLIAGLPGDSVDGFRDSFEAISQLGPSTINVYFFRLENSRYGEEARKNYITENSEDFAVRYLEATVDAASRAGYTNYSSNPFLNSQLFVRKDFVCLIGNQPTEWHPEMRNSMIGLGVGARSFMENAAETINFGPGGSAALGRVPNPLDPGFRFSDSVYRFSRREPADRMRDFVLKAFYKTGNVSRSLFKTVFGLEIESVFRDEIETLQNLGKLSVGDDSIEMLCDGFEKAVLSKFFYNQEELISVAKRPRGEIIIST
nr:radical SAM protein [bacterium]